MIDPVTHRILALSPEETLTAMNAVMPQLTPDIRKRLNRVKLSYLQHYGLAGLYERVNNRTIGEILGDELPDENSRPIASGEIDGVRYELYESPGE